MKQGNSGHAPAAEQQCQVRARQSVPTKKKRRRSTGQRQSGARERPIHTPRSIISRQLSRNSGTFGMYHSYALNKASRLMQIKALVDAELRASGLGVVHASQS